jgi:hypothetical protein
MNRIKDKYKNVSAISFSAYNDQELIISFTGFEQEEDLHEFCEFVFRSIRMPYRYGEQVPTIH